MYVFRLCMNLFITSDFSKGLFLCRTKCWTILKRCNWQCICSVAIRRIVAVYTVSTLQGHVGKLKDLFLLRTNYSAILKKNSEVYWQCTLQLHCQSLHCKYTSESCGQIKTYFSWISMNVLQTTCREKVILMSTILFHDYWHPDLKCNFKMSI